MPVSLSGPRFRWWAGLVLLSLLFSLNSVAAAQESAAVDVAAADNTLSGAVTIDGRGAPAVGAIVAGRVGLAPFVHTTVDSGTGAYSLTVGAGAGSVSVLPPEPSTTSPNWVYTAGAVNVSFSGHNQTQTLNFTAQAADGTIHGRLQNPDGSFLFGPGNRAWVHAENSEGQGNTVQIDPANGNFSLNVLSGNVHLRLRLENPLVAPPSTLAGSVWTVDSSANVDAGTLQLLAKTASVSGVVRNKLSNSPVGGIPVHAWRRDGTDHEWTLSDATTGAYTLHMVPGVWEVRATVVDGPANQYVPAQSPQTVRLGSGDSQTQNLLVAPLDSTVDGTIINSDTLQPVNDALGRVYTAYRDADGRRQIGPGAPIVIEGGKSVFHLKLASAVATKYEIFAYFPPNVHYSAAAAARPVEITPGGTVTTTLPAVPDNSTISGHFLDRATGQPKTGEPGIVYAASNSGGRERARVNPLDASYSLNVASTATQGQGGSTWWLHAFVDPITGYVVQDPWAKIFLPYNNGQGSNAAHDFTVAAADSIIEGTVRRPNGEPVHGARVVVREVTGGGGFDRSEISGPNGHFRIRVPAGAYKVTAHKLGDPLDRNVISPEPATVTLGANETRVVNLQFRRADQTISGRVALNGTGHAAMIRGYSATGGHAATTTLDGSYSLPVNGHDTWYIEAVSEDGSVFYRSPQTTVVIGTENVTGVDLALAQTSTLPQRVAFSFDPTADQVITLDDGSQVQVPANAMGMDPTKPVTILARPKVEAESATGAKLVSFAYELYAFAANNDKITHFAAPVTLVIPFTNVQLSQLGITAQQLIPSYWDEGSGSWVPVDHVSVVLSGDGGTVNIQVDHFTTFALLADVSPGRTSLPLVVG